MSPTTPKIYHFFKPTRITSTDMIRKFKRVCPRPFKKMGHFGTLDPFACGVLLVGINGACRLNDYIHNELSKTYLAIGKIGSETDTGDCTGSIIMEDLDVEKSNLPNMSMSEIQSLLEEKFLGEYMQAPHMFSAAKHEGKPLYEYARAGIEIKKEKKRRFIHKIEVVKYHFPYISIRFEVSSGTFIRTLFSDSARELGSMGSLIGLVRESIGPISFVDGIKNLEKENLPYIEIDSILTYPKWTMDMEQTRRITSGSLVSKNIDKNVNKYWAIGDDGKLKALVESRGEAGVHPIINFPS